MKRFGALAILTALILCGCGNTPKQAAQDFITACTKGDYKKAAGMVYRDGEFLTERNTNLRIGSRVSGFHKFFDGKIWSARKDDQVRYKLSPRDPVFETGNPNKCRVCVITTIFRDGKQIPTSTTEVAWPLEKVNGKWVITGYASYWE